MGSISPSVLKLIHSDVTFMNERLKNSSTYEKIYIVAHQIPYGKVATYSLIASLVDKCSARMVGYAMANLPFNTDVPWHRVINSRGEISVRADGSPSEEQRYLLETEGITFNKQGRVDLEKVCWRWERFADSKEEDLICSGKQKRQ